MNRAERELTRCMNALRVDIRKSLEELKLLASRHLVFKELLECLKYYEEGGGENPDDDGQSFVTPIWRVAFSLVVSSPSDRQGNVSLYSEIPALLEMGRVQRDPVWVVDLQPRSESNPLTGMPIQSNRVADGLVFSLRRADVSTTNLVLPLATLLDGLHEKKKINKILYITDNRYIPDTKQYLIRLESEAEVISITVNFETLLQDQDILYPN